MEQVKDLACFINGCQPCKLVRLVCQVLKHKRDVHLHCRWCGVRINFEVAHKRL